MFRNTLTTLSLIGLLLSVGLWGVSYWKVGYYSSEVGILFRLGAIVGPCKADQVALVIWLTRVQTAPLDMRQTDNFEFVTENNRNKWLVGGYNGLRTTWLPSLGSPGKSLYLPLWMPTLLFGLWPAWLLLPLHRRRKRKKLGLCVKCGYDLRASKERCPECGTTIER